MATELRNRHIGLVEEVPIATAIVTGANTGIGKETAIGLAACGKYDLVILACRSKEKTEQAIQDIIKRLPSDCKTRLEYVHLDLSSLEATRECAVALTTRSPPIAIKALVNNAGLGTLDYTATTKDGLELCFGVNFVGPFLFTNLLLPNIKASAPSRIVNLASVMHRRGSPKLVSYEKGLYKHTRGSYPNSKMAMVLFTTQLDKMLKGTGVEVHAVNPGAVNSDIWRALPWYILMIAKFIFAILFLNTKQGAATSIHAATADGIGSNKYWTPYWIPIISLASYFDTL
eukprot:Ihof_evm6s87 gene=Ihof_evmTU6s87